MKRYKYMSVYLTLIYFRLDSKNYYLKFSLNPNVDFAIKTNSKIVKLKHKKNKLYEI